MFARFGQSPGKISLMRSVYEEGPQSASQIAAREMLLKLPHPKRDVFMTTGLAVKLGATPGKIARPPLLGEDTCELLRALRYSEGEIDSLRSAGVIGSPDVPGAAPTG